MASETGDSSRGTLRAARDLSSIPLDEYVDAGVVAAVDVV